MIDTLSQTKIVRVENQFLHYSIAMGMMVPRWSEVVVRRGPMSPNVAIMNILQSFALQVGQLLRHLPLGFENCECCVTVFNSSVEKRVEKLHAACENALQHGAYCSLHKSCASASQSSLREE